MLNYDIYLKVYTSLEIHECMHRDIICIRYTAAIRIGY